MGYPDNILADGEQVVVHHHRHWKTLVWPTIALLLISAICGAAAGFIAGSALSATPRTILSLVTLAVWFTIATAVFARAWVRWISTHFVITDRRVTYRTGVFARQGIDIPVQRISSVEFRHSLIDRMLGTGTLMIESSSGEPLRFHDIPHIGRVHALLYNEVEHSQPDASQRMFDL